MKRIAICLLLLFALAPFSSALEGRYKVFSTRTGWLGLGHKEIILLDSKSGHSWSLRDNTWQPIARVDELSSDASDESSALNDQLMKEISALKQKQAEDIQALKSKQEEDFRSFTSKWGISKPTSVRHISHTYRHRPSASTAVERNSDDQTEENGNDTSAPSWFNQKPQ
ncbi:MAG TPA: hypothetical protein VMD02_00370 [Candidatus Omnitrophota bacterium]|nr:hypothetical protein [Candidatus Omnitrophota bacterium]